MNIEEVVYRIAILRRQETTTYRCQDYMGHVHCQVKDHCSTDSQFRNLNESLSCCDELPSIDEDCRKKMIDWSFRVADHFHADRGLVSISTNYLDRFLSKYYCDRTSFKLAALTTLYMTAKIHGVRNRSLIPLTTLVQLSDGEFDSDHVSKMEGIILSTLNWALYPPTSAEFIYLYMRVFALQNVENIISIIQERAIFLSELAVSDYFFVPYEPSTIALAAIFNTFEHEDISLCARSEFLTNITRITGGGFSHQCVNAARNRLWVLHSQTVPSQNDNADLGEQSTGRHDVETGAQALRRKVELNKETSTLSLSPTCISRC